MHRELVDVLRCVADGERLTPEELHQLCSGDPYGRMIEHERRVSTTLRQKCTEFIEF
jgi:hypothetical protein